MQYHDRQFRLSELCFISQKIKWAGSITEIFRLLASIRRYVQIVENDFDLLEWNVELNIYVARYTTKTVAASLS